MNRRRFLGSVPVLAACGVAAAFFGRLFGVGKNKPFSAGRLRREPELMAGGDAELMASWEAGLQVDRDKGIAYMPDGTVEWYTGPPIDWHTEIGDGKNVRMPTYLDGKTTCRPLWDCDPGGTLCDG